MCRFLLETTTTTPFAQFDRLDLSHSRGGGSIGGSVGLRPFLLDIMSVVSDLHFFIIFDRKICGFVEIVGGILGSVELLDQVLQNDTTSTSEGPVSTETPVGTCTAPGAV